MDIICYMSDTIWAINGLLGGVIVLGLGISFIYHMLKAKEKKNG